MERILDAGISHLDDLVRTPDADALDRLDADDLTGAVQLLMKRHGTRVYRFCRAALRDAALADDVHQLVFVQVLRDLPQFQRRAPLLSWILSIAHNRVIDAAKLRRRTQSRLDAIDLTEVLDGSRPANEEIDHARLVAALTAALDTLDVATRTAVLLRYQQGLSFEEMADVCHEKSGTLQARVARALPRLRTLITRRMRDRAD